jgi:hypothetical protein
VRTDFYELYWADLTAGSTWDQFTGWVRGLLLRPLSRVPPDVRLAWVALWIATLIVIALAGLAAVPADSWRKIGANWLAEWHWLLAFVAAAFGAWLHKIATATFGRVVRYTKADPDNIAARQAVRERGLKLLSALHEGTHYKRIIIVSHSLGTMLAHDLLSYFWAQREAPRRIAETSPEFDALCELERAAAAVDLNPTAAALDQYYEAQRRLRVALVARAAPLADDPQTSPDPRWLITDFVTLGSPLAHAEFLIAANAEDLARRKFERELPESPPLREELDPTVFRLAQATHKLPVGADFKTSKLISFPPPSAPHVWELHHAAPFAVVRWVNVYDTASLVFRGDIIGGPLAKPFGPAIIDIDLKSLRGQSLLHPHQVLGDRRRVDPHRRPAKSSQSARPAWQSVGRRSRRARRLTAGGQDGPPCIIEWWHGYGLAAPAPASVPGVEHAGAGRAAVDAVAVRGEIPLREIVPVAADEGRAAAVAIGALARAIVDIAGIDVTQTRFHRDAPRRLQRRRRRRRRVRHLPVGMKGGEVQRHVGAEMLHHPAALRLDFLRRVVLAGNEQGRDLEPNIGLVLEVFERLEHGAELARTQRLVEPLRESLEIDVGGVHVAEEFDARLRRDVAGAHRHRLDPARAAGLRYIHRVFQKDHGIVVGKCDRAAAASHRRLRDRLRRGEVLNAIERARFRNVPVLAELAGQVATRRAKGQHRRAGEKLIERLLLDWIDAKAGGAAVGGQQDLTVLARAHEA